MDKKDYPPRSPTPEFTICEDKGRARIESYVRTSKFRVGDQVYLNREGAGMREGPFLIASVPFAGRYTLCFEDGSSAENGKEYEEKDLAFA